MTLIETIIIAIVEGLTEFLPVSSTGHMIITQNLLGVTDRMQDDPTMAAFVHAFTFIIQFGAILSVVCLYWKRFFQFDNTTVFKNERIKTTEKQFYRDLNNKMVAGVLSGFASYTNTNVLFWRLGTVVLSFFCGIGLLAYIIMAMAMPSLEKPSWLQRIRHKYYFYWLLIVGVIPAVVIGLAAKKSGLLDWLLDSVLVVAIMLVLGGVFMLYCDKIFNKPDEKREVTERSAFNIGLFQCISVIPGVSRSMATIVGGMAQGLTRRRAAEFSFFLAVPTMAGATVLDLFDLMKEGGAWATTSNITMLIVGCVVAFIVALLAMKWFVNFVSKYGFKAFGIYRIIVGVIILVLIFTGHSLSMVD